MIEYSLYVQNITCKVTKNKIYIFKKKLYAFKAAVLVINVSIVKCGSNIKSEQNHQNIYVT